MLNLCNEIANKLFSSETNCNAHNILCSKIFFINLNIYYIIFENNIIIYHS